MRSAVIDLFMPFLWNNVPFSISLAGCFDALWKKLNQQFIAKRKPVQMNRNTFIAQENDTFFRIPDADCIICFLFCIVKLSG